MNSSVTLGGFTRHIRIDGAESAPWLVLSNSLGADLSMWDPQMDLLTARFRVLRYDTRGHGLTETPPGPYDLADLSQDVIDLLDHLAIADIGFIGLSLGGMTGLGLAIAHPRRINRLVCCDARADAPEPYVQGWTQRIAAVTASGARTIASATVERWLSPHSRAERPDLVQRLEAMICATSDQGYIACAAALQRLDYLRRLPAISCPSLFVTGALDGAAAPEVMAAMAALVPGADLAIVPEAAHISNLDNPAAFNRILGQFLGQPV